MGTGKQKIPAVANLIGYYGIGLTLSITFMFVAKLRVLGDYMKLPFFVIYSSGHEKLGPGLQYVISAAVKPAVSLTESSVFFSTGFWLGLLICVILQSTFYIIVIFKLNWKRMTEEVGK